MIPLVRVGGRAAPCLEPNVDTDVIIRIERLTQRADLRHYAFEALRYRDDGTPDPGCVFNQPAYRNAPILLAGRNFGCGSSREGAVAAIMALGFRVILAPSFGDIFHANCLKNGVLPVTLPMTTIEAFAIQAEKGDFIVDLSEQAITTPAGTKVFFAIDALSREGLMQGLDDIAMTRAHRATIVAWQERDRRTRPWIWLDGAQSENRT